MIFRKIAVGLPANDLNLLAIPDGIGVCCDESDSLSDYATAELNATTVGDVDRVIVKVDGGSNINLDFTAAIAWDDPANDAAVMEEISTLIQSAAVDSGNFIHLDGGIELVRRSYR